MPRTLRPAAGALLLLAVGTVLSAAPARAQYAEGGARTLALGRAGVALGGDAWGHLNPAAWASVEGGQAALQASQAFGLSELRLGALAAVLPTPVGVAALGARTYGFDEHRETRVVVGLGRTLPLSPTRRLDVALAVGYESAATEGFGSSGSVLVSAGVQGEVLSRLRIGLAGRNLLGIVRGEDDDLRHSAATVPGVAVGLAYAASDRAVLVLDADQDLDFGLSVRGGIEVRPVDALALRVGAGSEPVRFSAGAGVVVGPLRADLAVELHQELGMTPAVGVAFGF